MTQWANWATEPVRVVAADNAWQQLGERECRRLDARLAQWLAAPVEHVGSTAVPGLPAKPILDLQAAVANLECAGAVATGLAADGWNYVPPTLDGRPWRRFLVKVEAGRRVAHLQLVAAGRARWHHQLVFRDALRADPELARRYAKLKETLASRHSHDRERYTAGKAEFIVAVLLRYGADVTMPDHVAADGTRVVDL